MPNFRRWRGHESELEAQLRAARVEPRDEFVSGLSLRIASKSGAHGVRPWSRVAFAGAVTTLMLGTFASFGGIGYAASGADHTYQTVKTLVVKHSVTVRHSAASDQYGNNPTPPSKPPSKPTGSVAGNQAAGGVEAAAAQGGTLPFTGFSLLATVLVGLALIAAGIVLRRRERTNS